MKRRLTTILCADGVRFSAMMERDEDATLKRLHRSREIMGELFARHDGRQVNTWGDAVIAEFASVVEAVRCAVEIQEAVAGENALLPEDKRMYFRIGVNLGDVMIDGADLYGDGVNVAARLQEMSDPGGVVVSEAVYDFAHKQLALGFDALGEQKVKSMEEPVSSYAVRMSRRNAPAETPQIEKPKIRLSDDDAFTKAGGFLDSLRRWVMAQPRSVQRSAGFIVMFFMINLIFSGLAFPWFLFASAPFAFHIFRHARRGRETAPQDGGEA